MISSAVLKHNFEQLHVSISILYDFIEPVDVFVYSNFWVVNACIMRYFSAKPQTVLKKNA